MKGLAITGGALLTLGLIVALMPAYDLALTFELKNTPTRINPEEAAQMFKLMAMFTAVIGTIMLLAAVVPSAPPRAYFPLAEPPNPNDRQAPGD